MPYRIWFLEIGGFMETRSLQPQEREQAWRLALGV